MFEFRGMNYGKFSSNDLRFVTGTGCTANVLIEILVVVIITLKHWYLVLQYIKLSIDDMNK